MRTLQIALMVTVLLIPVPLTASDALQLCGEEEPTLAVPHPPRSLMKFTRSDRSYLESLKISYLEPGRISFTFDRTGTCELHEKGTALIKPCWWLGLETDENEAGETIAVQEYIFHKSSRCKMYLRIDEEEWSQATIVLATECSECISSSERLRPAISSGGPNSRRRP